MAKIKTHKPEKHGCESCACDIGHEIRKLAIAQKDASAQEAAVTKKSMDTAKKQVSAKTLLNGRSIWHYGILGAGAAMFASGLDADDGDGIKLAFFITAYLLIGGDVVWRALKNIAKGRIFDENFLMSIATLGAFAIGEYPEGVAVMLFFKIGEEIEHIAVDSSRKAITDLMNIRPDYANIKIGEELKRVPPESVDASSHIVVRPGEKIPLDGIVTEGSGAIDTSALTGESLPRDVYAGDEILSGCVNLSGLLTIKVTKPFSESAVSKILQLVQDASSRKSKAEKFITKFARYYTPAVVFSAAVLAIIPPLVIPDAVFSQWLYRALVFLVVSCPCALVISIPMSFFGGIGGASRNGILIKGSNYLEALSNVDTVVFDKTGTLTKGVFTVTDVVTADGTDREKLMRIAAQAESASTHPIAVSIREAYGKAVDMPKEIEELAGFGVRAKIDGQSVLAGNAKLLSGAGIDLPIDDTLGTVVYIAIDGRYAGHIVISDVTKPDSERAIALLKQAGVKKTIMLTGDGKAAGERTAKELGLDLVYFELLPHQKVEKVEEIDCGKHSKGTLVFVGDGINDAPVLARADIGVAMGGVGSDAAIEAADVVLMTDEPSKVAIAIKIAKKTKRIVLQNIVFALGVKAIILVLGAMGIANMWAAVFADVGVTLIAILNAIRAMRVIRTQ
ncbi:MAG: cadmium-translocating P-type ATPase [Oscillospiraceae bacterium]|nr:cadmium-translocating P-type ATPase [Oscillospiraceae bacterium]